MSAELMSKIAAVPEGQAMLLSVEEVAQARQALEHQKILLDAQSASAELQKRVAAIDWTALLGFLPKLLPALISLLSSCGIIQLINAILAALLPNVTPIPVPAPTPAPIPGGGGGPVPAP